MRLNKRYQDGGKFTEEQRAEYQKYFDENYPFVDSIEEYFSSKVEQPQQPPASIALRRMFPLPPVQNQITGTDQRQLAEMLLDERKKGREAVRVMKADQTMDTGHTPDYDVTWDEERKQWRMRDIPQEEKDRYRREHKVFRTPRISF